MAFDFRLVLLLMAIALGWTAAAAGEAVTWVELANPGAADLRDVPVTFGQVFKPGDLPPATGLAARGPDGETVPLQVDAKATHRAGSLRHAVLTLRLPALPAGRPIRVELLPVPAAKPGPALAVESLLASGYEAAATLRIGSDVYTASAKSLLEDARKKGTLPTWLAGPLATEWSVAAPFRKADGTAHPHLSARFDIRAYSGNGPVRTDICIENDWAFEPKPSGFAYDVSLSSGGTEVFERKGLKHTHHARWHRVVWWGAEPAVHIRQDPDYLIASRAVSNYDRSLRIRSAALANLPAAYEPMDNGGLRSGMPDGGAHADIGPLPTFAVLYLLTMDPAARANTLANGGAGGSFQIHYRDRRTGLPVSIDDYPYMGIYGTPGNKLNPSTHKSEAFPEVTNGMERHVPDDSHQPSVGYLPYLISGDRFYLDELLFWANYNLVLMNPEYRYHARGVFGYGQMRAIAWNLRTLGQTAYITPDAHPMKQYFEEKLRNNIVAFNQTFTGASPAAEKSGRPEGFLSRLKALLREKFHGGAETGGPPYPGAPIALGAIKWSQWDGFIRPWMDDFVTWSFGYLVELGYVEATPMLRYKTRFVVGRMTPPFHWQHASMYDSVGRDAAGHYFTHFGDYYRANFKDAPTGLVMDGYPESPFGYGAFMQPALAIAVDAGTPGAREAWDRYQTRNPRQDFESAPTWAIVPRR